VSRNPILSFIGAIFLLLSLPLPFGIPASAQDTSGEALGGTLSADPEGWAFRPSIVVSADGLPIVAWTQHRNPAVWELSGTYVKRWVNGRWIPLGGRIGHTLGQLGARWPEGYSPSIAVLNNTPHVAWYEGGGYGWGQAGDVQLRSSIFVAQWDGGQWVYYRSPDQPHGALNLPVGEVEGGIAASGRDPRLAVIRGVLYAAWIEAWRNRGNVLVVKHLEQNRWVQDGRELSLAPGTYGWIIDLALADVGGIPHVAWSEFSRRRDSIRPPTLQVASLIGGRWIPLGRPISASTTGLVGYLALTAHNGIPVVAWQEREPTGHNLIHVRQWNGRIWEPLGSALNSDAAKGEAGRPALASDGTRLWLAWAEGQPGRPASLYVRVLGPTGWDGPRGPLNLAPGLGAADSPALAASNGRVYIAWAEKSPPPATKQVYVKQLR
jgi:hypothetical protein